MMVRKPLSQPAVIGLIIGGIVNGVITGCSDAESGAGSAFLSEGPAETSARIPVGIPAGIPIYETPLKDATAIRAELQSACETAVANAEPLLVEFSAPWCSDCQRLHQMKQSGPLAEEIDRWPVVVVNVDQFDHHRDLLEGFGVRKIAHWAVLEPTDCSRPAERWKRRIQRTLEPASGNERSRTPADLARWLRDLRES